MFAYIVRRLALMIVTLFGISVIIFIILHLSGDPTLLLLAPDATKEDIENFRQLMGFNDPLFVRWPPWEYLNPPWRFLTDTQYGRFFTGVVRGDFGNSLRHQQPAMELVLERMPATVELTAAAMLLAVVVAVPVGIVSAVRRNSFLDHAGMVLALLGQSMPVYWLGIMFILLFAVRLNLLPAFGSGSWQHLVLPGITLGAFSMARIARLTRSSMLEALGQEYVRTARAKGVSEVRVVVKHTLKNAAIPVITVIGLDRVGIVAGISRVMAEHNVNIADIRQTIMNDLFTMIMLAEVKSENFDLAAFQEAMSAIGRELGVQVIVQHEDVFRFMHRI